MKSQNTFKFILLTLVLSTLSTSCGLIEKFRNPEKPTDSKSSETTSTDAKTNSDTDDLFSKTMNDSKDQTKEVASDAPSNINAENQAAEADLKSLENDFSAPAKGPESKQVKVEESLPEIKSESAPAITESTDSNAGKVMNYKVKKGETLMQIAFKIYGDLSKWKELKQMNQAKFSKNAALRTNMELKYTAPEKVFVWNPEGTPYMIKTGETLGIISKSVYKNANKWKRIWENNKPLIKNPNVIYTGFTLYYKGDGLADYVTPRTNSPELSSKINTKTEDSIAQQEIKEKLKEEVKVEQTISNLEQLDSSNEIDMIKEVKSATLREDNSKAVSDDAKIEALGN